MAAAASSFDQAVTFAINEREEAETIQTFLSKHAVDSPVPLDASGKAAQTFRVLALPTVVLIDMQGRVRSVHYDISETFVDRLNAELRALVQESRLDIFLRN